MTAKASNAPCNTPIEIYRGDTWSLQLQAKRPDGTIVNLSGWALPKAQIRQKRKNDTFVANFVATIDNAASGLFSLTLEAAATAALECGESRYDVASQYVWDVEFTSPSGHKYTPHSGTATVLADVYRVS